MSTILYSKGDTHEKNGIKCKIEYFEAVDVSLQLNNGWFTTVEGVYGLQAYDEKKEGIEKESKKDLQGKSKQDQESSEEEQKQVLTPEKPFNLEDKSNTEIRGIAKKAGIKTWKTARINKLISNLNDVEKS